MPATSLQWERVEYYDPDDELLLIEIIPTADHDEGPDCWCDPWVARDCTECRVVDEDCWKCGGRGFVDYPADEYIFDLTPIVIHHDPRLP